MTSPIVPPLDMSTPIRRVRRQSETSDGSVCSKSTEPGNYSGSILDDSTAVIDESKVILDETHISDCSSSRDSNVCVMETQPSFLFPKQSEESSSDTEQIQLEESMGIVNSPNNTPDVMGDSDSDDPPPIASQKYNSTAPVQVSLDQSKKSIDLFESDEDEPTPPVSPPHCGGISVASPSGSVCSSVMDSYPLSQPITPACGMNDDNDEEDLETDASPSHANANNSGDSATPPTSPPAIYQQQQDSLHEEPVGLHSPIPSTLPQENDNSSKHNQEKWAALYAKAESDDESELPTSPHLLSTSTPCPDGTLPISLEAIELDGGDGKKTLEMDRETDVMSSQSSDDESDIVPETQQRNSPLHSNPESQSVIEDTPSPRKKRKIIRRSDIIAATTAGAGPASSPRRKQASSDKSATDDSDSGGCDMEEEVDVTFSEGDFSSVRSASASDSVPMELCTPYEPLEKLIPEFINTPFNPLMDQEQDLMDEPVPSPLLSRRSAKSTRGKSLQSGAWKQNSRTEKTPELAVPSDALSDAEAMDHANESAEVAVNETPIQPAMPVNKTSKARRGKPFHHAERRKELPPPPTEPETVTTIEDVTEPAQFAHPSATSNTVAGKKSGRLTKKAALKMNQSDADVLEPNSSLQSDSAEASDADPSVLGKKKRAAASLKNSNQPKEQPVAPLPSSPAETVVRRSNRAPAPNLQLNAEVYEVQNLSAAKPSSKVAAEAPKSRGRPSKIRQPVVPVQSVRESSSPRRGRSNIKEGNPSNSPPETAAAALPVIAQNTLDQSAMDAEELSVPGKKKVEKKNKEVAVPGSKEAEEEVIVAPAKKSGRPKKEDKKLTAAAVVLAVAPEPPVAEIPPVEALADQPPVEVPRKRGRPKKADKNLTATAAVPVLNASENMSPETKANQSDSKTPKKRGRPSKQDKKLQLAALAAAAAYDEETDTESTIMVPPKPNAAPLPGPSGRGRQAKGKKPLATLNTSTASVQPRKIRSSSNSSACSNNNATASESDSSTVTVAASRRKKRALAGQVRVMFTGAHDENLDALVEELGGRVVSSSKDCAVLVTDAVRRTVKFLCVVGLGLPVVDSRWLAASKEKGKFVDPWIFLLKDKEGEEKFKFKLETSLKSASEKPLLAGWLIGCTPSVKPPPEELKEIVESAGGIFTEDNEDKKWTDDNRLILVSCADDRKIWPKWTSKGFRVVDKEACLLGVLAQNFLPDQFLL